ncbi:MAG TPA: methionine ABC transporter permease [Rhabdochlamydiaceae bacterium]|nr:methionine ABC transporter permease [Rhabdochlamydiaceae bacterium]
MTSDLFSLLLFSLGETLYMVFASIFFATLIGMPLGILLFLTKKGHLKERPMLHKILGAVVNLGRSFPFAILMVALIPVTRWIIGTSLGTTASIVPLSFAAAPFIARQVENCLNEIGREILEAAIVMGSSIGQIIYKVLLAEALPSLIQALTLTIINLIGYSAMAGLVGGGGLGTVAIQYGYQRFNGSVMFWTVILLILLVEIIQTIGSRLAARLRKKRGQAHE